MYFCVFFFKQKTAYEMRISDWSSDVCSSDLIAAIGAISAASAAFDPANDLQLPILADGNGTSDFVRFALGEDRNFGQIQLGAAHRSSKNHIFNAPAAHGLGRAFAHDPADRKSVVQGQRV